MASDDRHERVRGALTVARTVCLIYKKRRRTRTLAEWALVLDVLRGHGDDGGARGRGWGWSPRQVHSASPPTIVFLAFNAQESRAETPRLQRDQKISQALPHPVRVLGACKAGKATKVVLIGCKGRGREAVHTCGAEDQ